jgi:hypothetical protein
MEEVLLSLVVPGVGMVAGLMATYVSLQNRALLAEVRKELAELENRIIIRINGTFARASEIRLRDEHVEARLKSLAEEIRKRGAAGD